MSLPENYIPEIKQILESISDNMQGFTPRLPQKKMIAAISEVLSRAEPAKVNNGGNPPHDAKEPVIPTGETFLVVEGPTGVGKSLGYLIGAAVPAKFKKRKIIVSSATVALQDQLVNRDIPMFIKASGLSLRCMIAKGRTRYVCYEKLAHVVDDALQSDMFVDEQSVAQQKKDEAVDLYTTLLDAYEKKLWNGDRDNLEAQIDDGLWGMITTDHGGCLNGKCPSYGTCAQMKARDGLRNSDIIVTNHDLLLADFALGGGAVLPGPEESFYIVDEAHHLPTKATGAFSSEHRVETARNMMNKLSALSTEIGKAYPDLRDKSIELARSAGHLARHLGEFYTMLNKIDPDVFIVGNNMWRFPENRFPSEALPVGQQIQQVSYSVLTQAARVKDKLNDIASDANADVAKKMLSEIGFYSSKVDALSRTWDMLLEEPSESAPPTAKWVERVVKGNNILDFNLKACPVAAGGLLRSFFFNHIDGAVLTSATLRTLGNFDSFLRNCGLSHYPEVSTLALPSPFDYQRQGILHVPAMKANPKNAAMHTEAIIQILPGAIKSTGNKGTLVLFSSRKQMTDVLEKLPAEVANVILVQGASPRSELLATHCSRIDSGNPSVLFGMQSFAEGLDLPGDYCAHVIIAKIPFAVPSDPVQETLADWLASLNRSYFSEVALPQASLRMIQWAGRLIRSENDRGAISILDNRLTSTSYGKQILKSLPGFAMAGSEAEVLNHISRT